MEDSTHIDSTKISLYIQQLEFTVSNLEATITRMKKECFDPKKFYGTAITVDACTTCVSRLSVSMFMQDSFRLIRIAPLEKSSYLQQMPYCSTSNSSSKNIKN